MLIFLSSDCKSSVYDAYGEFRTLYLHGSRLAPKGTSSSQAGSRQPTRTRGRIMRTTGGRGRGSGVIMGARPVVPAPFVPEELVSQAQVVLQGKSRNLIIRELQRTVFEALSLLAFPRRGRNGVLKIWMNLYEEEGFS